MKVLQAIQGVGIDSEVILLKCTFLMETHFTEVAPKLLFFVLYPAVKFKPGTAGWEARALPLSHLVPQQR